MKDTRVTVEMWHELEDRQKEVLRTWAVRKGLGLEIVQSQTAETCDYALLLTTKEAREFLLERGVTVQDGDLLALWGKIKQSV